MAYSGNMRGTWAQLKLWLASDGALYRVINKEKSMKRVGLVGWRGMVGSVLMQRMQEEKDFDLIDPVFFTTSQAGQAAPCLLYTSPSPRD